MKKSLFIVISLVLSVINSHADTISFGQIVLEVEEKSLDVDAAREDVHIAYASKLKYSTHFLPTIYALGTTEYTGDLRKAKTIFGKQDNSEWRTSASINAEWNIFNGGNDYEKYKIASLEHDIKSVQVIAVEKNVMLKLVSTYEQILSSYNSMLYYSKMADSALELYHASKRLYESGLIDVQQQYLAGVKYADYNTQKLMAEKNLRDAYQDLSYYTLKEYDALNLVPIDFSVNKVGTKIIPESYPEYQVIQMQLLQNDRQFSINNNSWFPTVTVFGKYNVHGTDRSSFKDSLEGVESDDWRVGVSVRFDIFNGGTYVYNRMSLLAERPKLEINRLQILKQIQIEVAKMEQSQEYIETISKQTSDSGKFTQSTLETGAKLRGENLMGATQMLNNELDTLEKTLSQRLIDIRMSADAKRLEITGKYMR